MRIIFPHRIVSNLFHEEPPRRHFLGLGRFSLKVFGPKYMHVPVGSLPVLKEEVQNSMVNRILENNPDLLPSLSQNGFQRRLARFDFSPIAIPPALPKTALLHRQENAIIFDDKSQNSRGHSV